MKLSTELTILLEHALDQPSRDALTGLIQSEVDTAYERGYKAGVWETKYAIERFVSDKLDASAMWKERDE